MPEWAVLIGLGLLCISFIILGFVTGEASVNWVVAARRKDNPIGFWLIQFLWTLIVAVCFFAAWDTYFNY